MVPYNVDISVSEEQAGSSNIAIPWVFLIKQAFALME
jgi:hypothetical protein